VIRVCLRVDNKEVEEEKEGKRTSKYRRKILSN
jgi:hypothetical protein